MDRIEEIIAILETAEESLIDLSMNLLSDAIESGAGVRPPQEKSISSARRSVRKAIEQLKTAQ